MRFKKSSPYGEVCATLEKGGLLKIKSVSDLGAFWGQGYASVRLRLWQMDLSRRIALGELSEILGVKAYKTDLFQRKLGLADLADKEIQRVNNSFIQTKQKETQSKIIEAYLAGANEALKKIIMLPLECLLLRYRPRFFTKQDIYALANLKYFINSAWQYELFHTKILEKLNPSQARQLFQTFDSDGGNIAPLPYKNQLERSFEAEQALQEGLEGLRLLGLSSPDIGSNVFVIGKELSANKQPWLAADPHMGQVNPGFCLLCQIKSEEGLSVFGANFPGIPGIVVGRNQNSAWGMVGLMADNQDLFWAKLNKKNNQVETLSGWQELKSIEQTLKIKKQKDNIFKTYFFKEGRLLKANQEYGLFLRWPALDSDLGDIVLYDLAKSYDWLSFRKSLKKLHNAPMMVGYANINGDIALQASGLFPKRKAPLGSLIQKLKAAKAEWQGYWSFYDLPYVLNPKEGYLIYSNQFSSKLFNSKVSISNRWHPPSRFLRIEELIKGKKDLEKDDLIAIQDDKYDYFVRNQGQQLLDYLDEKSILKGWTGDTAEVEKSMLFDQLLYELLKEICAKTLGFNNLALYVDFWPSYRWAALDIFNNYLPDWPINLAKKELLNLAYLRAKKAMQKSNQRPQSVWSHAFKKPNFLKNLLSGKIKFQGGNRETVHATRQVADFLTNSQSTNISGQDKDFTFGPAFKFLSNLEANKAPVWYLNSAPAKGNPFFCSFGSTLKDWQKNKRQQTNLI